MTDRAALVEKVARAMWEKETDLHPRYFDAVWAKQHDAWEFYIPDKTTADEDGGLSRTGRETYYRLATAAIDLIRAEVLEEAARACEERGTVFMRDAAAAIRGLNETKAEAVTESDEKTFMVVHTKPVVEAYAGTVNIGPATEVIHLPEIGEPGTEWHRKESWQADWPTWDQDTKPVITGFSINGPPVLQCSPPVVLTRGVTPRITFPVRLQLFTKD